MKPLMIWAGCMFIESFAIRLAEKNDSPAVFKIPLRRNRSVLQRRAASKITYEMLSDVCKPLNFSFYTSHHKSRWALGL